ncbi:MAG: GNAT family N-acetyltransferase [Rhodospirillaceae bacterium]|nr:GNAT family N-acetyltransferase [Rhodospirillaceae bacterium]
MVPPLLFTQRLRLRPRSLDDLEANLAMDMDPRVHRYIWPDGPPDRQERLAQLREQYGTDQPHPRAIWTVEWADRPGFLGWCGVFPLEDSGLIEIGYRYIAAIWGQGVGTEAAREVLDHGFRAMAIDPIVAVAHPDNRASRRLLEKIGLEPAGTAFHYRQWLAFYRLNRRDYLSAPQKS